MAKSALTGLEEPWDHVESDNSYDQQEAQRRSARDKHPTEKGFEYILNLRRQSAIAAKRSWRKQINLIHSFLVTQKGHCDTHGGVRRTGEENDTLL